MSVLGVLLFHSEGTLLYTTAFVVAFVFVLMNKDFKVFLLCGWTGISYMVLQYVLVQDTMLSVYLSGIATAHTPFGTVMSFFHTMVPHVVLGVLYTLVICATVCIKTARARERCYWIGNRFVSSDRGDTNETRV